MQQIFQQVNERNIVRSPHTAGERSVRHATRIAALGEHERTALQARMLHRHEQGECIGCTRQGIPLDSAGNELSFRYEPNGFASPPQYCDCPKGEQYRLWIAQRRVAYEQERVQEHLRYLRYLFGSTCILPTVMTRWTLESWPVDLPWPQEWEEQEKEHVRLYREHIRESAKVYAENLAIWDETVSKPGIGLFGAPGVGKSGLLRSLEPLILAHGASMVSLYVPDLMVALESNQVEHMIAGLLATDVVLFDNLGSLVSLGYRETQGRLAFIRLLNARWEREQKTLFTSNLTVEQLADQYGEDSVSRLHALCRFMEVPGVDLRKGGKN